MNQRRYNLGAGSRSPPEADTLHRRVKSNSLQGGLYASGVFMRLRRIQISLRLTTPPPQGRRVNLALTTLRVWTECNTKAAELKPQARTGHKFRETSKLQLGTPFHPNGILIE